MARIVGIDLGTTYSAISYFDHEKGVPVIIPNLRGKGTTPSVVFMNEKGEAVVGEAAKRNQIADSANTIIEVKRKMGEIEVRKDDRGRQQEVAVRVQMRGKMYLPQEISAFILHDLKLAAEKFFGEPVHDAVITVPAYFLAAQKNATKEAGQLAGFNVHRLVSEPTAAAIAYGLDKIRGQKQIFAVYDLGGGTFDVSIIEVSEGNIEVLGTGGDPRLGGVDFDDKIVQWVLKEIIAKHHVDISGDEGARRRIKDVAEAAKIELSNANVTVISIPFVALVNNQPLAVSFPLERSDFEDMIMPRLRESVQCLEAAIASASKEKGIVREEIDAVLLVGGSTRIPVIRTLLERHLGKPVKSDLNPDEVVAMGAAIVASSLTPIGKSPDAVTAVGDPTMESVPAAEGGKAPVVFDVTGHTLGIRVMGLPVGQGDFQPLIRKEATIPTRGKKDSLSNAADFTTELALEVFQGEDIWADRNTKIGEVKLENLTPLEAGKHQFEVMFNLDSSEVLTVEAKDLRTGREVKEVLTYQGGTKMTSDEIARRRSEITGAFGGSSTAGGAVAPAEVGPGETGNAVSPPSAGVEIPNEFKGYYKKARALAESLPPNRAAPLNVACADLMRSVETGEPGAIKQAGEKLQLAYWDAQV